MNVVFEICDYNEFDPINGLHNPKGFIQKPVEFKNFYSCDSISFPKRNDIIKPFLQDYEYLVIGADQIYNFIKII